MLHQSRKCIVATVLGVIAASTGVHAEEPAGRSGSNVVEHRVTGKIDFISTDGTPLPDLRGLVERTLGIPGTSIGAQRIVGSDGRSRITTTTKSPWAAQCYLEITAGNGKSYRASGVLIGPKTVLTNGITVYNKNTGWWSRQIKVYPGRNGSSSPYGSVNAVSFKTFTAWTQNSSTSDNIGAIILDSPIGNTAGWYRVKTTSDSYLTNSQKRFFAYGYPTSMSTDKALYGMSGPVTGLADSGKQIRFAMDISGGQYGCPLFSDDREDGFWLTDPGWMPYVVGVIGAESSTSSPAYNVAARITSSNINTIKGWIQ
jgi:V8-like Glu-specific endopeptidase